MLEVVRRILWEMWDPIGVNDIPEAFGEYDSYAPAIVALLATAATTRDLEFHLSRLETDSMGLSRAVSPGRATAANALVALRGAPRQRVVPLELLDFESIASGAQSLRLTNELLWENFPAYAEQLVRLLDGTIDDRADSPAERVWAVSILGSPFWISFDDFGLGVSLDPRDPRAGALIPEIRRRLLSQR